VALELPVMAGHSGMLAKGKRDSVFANVFSISVVLI
jgi:hypothetical protein